MRNLVRLVISAILRSSSSGPETVRPIEDRYIWHVMTYGGGGAIMFSGLTRTEALGEAGRMGTIAYVDDDKHFIFVKPPGFSPSLPSQMG